LGNGIDRTEYKGKNKFLIGVELQPRDGKQFQINGNHQTKIGLKFKTATTEPLNLICMAELPSLLQVS
jgi:hypothetical protein